ncbi:hypothetical protein CLF_103357 [Clonorchis sinensis]|uniref:Uncharacterized protein n=1 Tax=Clonorchis sinensis TaxID=79923 RepID=G7Y9L8_CLOSI|nr:hypothetical protein CLF_103357 [Clonorchis sinensis]
MPLFIGCIGKNAMCGHCSSPLRKPLFLDRISGVRNSLVLSGRTSATTIRDVFIYRSGKAAQV